MVALVLKKNKTALDQLELSYGGRQGIIEALELTALDKKQQHFLDLLCDPKRANDSINVIARDSGLTPLQVQELFKTTGALRAQALAMAKLSEKIPGVVEDLASKAVDTVLDCFKCDKTGRILGEICPDCLGKGKIMRASSLDSQKVVLEAAGIIKKGGGVNVNVNQQVAVTQPGAFFSKFVKESDNAAYAVEGEVIKSDE